MALAHPAQQIATASEPAYRRYLLALTIGLISLLFLAAPWPFAQKAHAVFHGLCAQRPSHTLTFGGQPLPFDARMTGIYAGFLSTGVYLAFMGRYRASRVPS